MPVPERVSGSALLALSVAVVIWGTSFAAMKVSVSALPPVSVVFLRMATGTLLTLLFVRRWLPSRIPRRHWPILLLMAGSEPCLYFLLEAYALTLTTASQAGAVAAVMPLLTAVAAWATLSEPFGLRLALGLLLSIAGVGLLSIDALPITSAPNPPLGNLLEFFAMACGAVYAVSARYLTRWYNPWFLTSFQAWVGTLFFLPGIWLLPSWSAPAYPSDVLIAILYLGSVVTLGAYGLFNWGLGRIPAGQATLFINLIPVVAIVIGCLLLDDSLTNVQIAACAIVLAGVWIAQRPPPRRAVPSPRSPAVRRDAAVDRWSRIRRGASRPKNPTDETNLPHAGHSGRP